MLKRGVSFLSRLALRRLTAHIFISAEYVVRITLAIRFCIRVLRFISLEFVSETLLVWL